MELSKQAISLDLAKRLKELGVKQESLWGWTARYPQQEIYADRYKLWCSGAVEEWINDNYAAFTVAELGEMLPLDTVSGLNSSTGWTCSLLQRMSPENGSLETLEQYGDTEAEARGLMLEYLITNKLLSV